MKKKRGIVAKAGEEDLEKGNLFATGLVAGGALMGVIFAFLNISDKNCSCARADEPGEMDDGSFEGETGCISC